MRVGVDTLPLSELPIWRVFDFKTCSYVKCCRWADDETHEYNILTGPPGADVTYKADKYVIIDLDNKIVFINAKDINDDEHVIDAISEPERIPA